MSKIYETSQGVHTAANAFYISANEMHTPGVYWAYKDPDLKEPANAKEVFGFTDEQVKKISDAMEHRIKNMSSMESYKVLDDVLLEVFNSFLSGIVSSKPVFISVDGQDYQGSPCLKPSKIYHVTTIRPAIDTTGDSQWVGYFFIDETYTDDYDGSSDVCAVAFKWY